VSFMFDRVGVIRYPEGALNFDDLFETALEAGAQNIETTDKGYEIESTLEDFINVRDALIAKFGDPESSELIWKPQTTTALDEEKATSLFKLIDVLEDNDDVQSVFANFEVSDDVMEKIASKN
jgi:transcriptional/translational regulatory protein YebC/TACO1